MPLSEQSYRQVAQGTGLEPEKIKAVDEVESRGEGFLPSGEPRILFEAHWFSRFTDGKYDESHPEISSPEWDPSLYEGGAAEHDRLQEATDLNRDAALKSASWGRFQIMGFNWQACGYDSLQAFVNGMYESEEEHLRAFLAFLRNEDLLDPLRQEDWRTFARGYNGPKYDNHDYHIRLRDAYQEQIA
jgi:hypothetical protein